MAIAQYTNRASIQDPRYHADPDYKQRRRMFAALATLLIALGLVLVRDRQFWFPSSESDDNAAEDAQPSANGSTHAKLHSVPAPAAISSKSKHPAVAEPKPAVATAPQMVATNRSALPPLEVEVVAGDQHRKIRPGNNAVKIDMQPGSAAQAATTDVAPVTDAVERVKLSLPAADVVTHQVDPTYPLLARQMKVQGAVVLQALIGKEGLIQDLQVLSGPAILSSAAREAVKQWHFRPYLQSGQPVETQARITVNFTISTF
jgi:TonB family protein